MRVTRIKAIIFDLDGCLVDSERLVLEAIVDEMKAEGVADASFEEIRDNFLGCSLARIKAHVEARSGRPCADGFAGRIEGRLRAAYPDHLRRIDGVLPLLQDLKDRGIAVGIATGGSISRMGFTLQHSGLADWFNGTGFSAEMVQRGKPAPDIFLLAAEGLGVLPEDCAVMEDSPLGVTGAVTAGMRAVGFVGGGHLDGMRAAHAQNLQDTGASAVLYSLDGMLEALLDL